MWKRNKLNLTGHRYGQLTVIQEAGKNKVGRVLWLCKCDCGQMTTLEVSSLRQRNTLSCGCFQLKQAKTKGIALNLPAQRYHMLRKYGMTPEDKMALYEKQQRCCAICKLPMNFAESHIDHCHESNRVRGLAHYTCNTGFGMFKESPEIIRAALEYAERWSQKILWAKAG